MQTRRARLCWFLLLLAAAAWFTARGPVRAAADSADLVLIYAAARTWLLGQLPYDPAAQQATMHAINAWPTDPPRELLSLYPPTSFPLLVVPAALPNWPAARLLSMGVNTLAAAGLILCAALWAGLRPGTRGWWLLVIGALLLAPLHTAVRMGQTSILCAALLACGLLLARGGWRAAGGLLAGLACGLKPQLAGPVLLLLPAVRDWRTAAWAAAALLGLLLIGSGWMQLHGHHWPAAFLHNLQQFSQPGGEADPGFANPWRHDLVNLAVVLHALPGGSAVAGWAVAALLTAALAVAATQFARAPAAGLCRLAQPAATWALALLCVISLLAVYHRVYDAVLLVFVLAWWARGIASGQLSGPRAWAGGALLALFLLPGPAMLAYLAQAGSIPPALLHSWIWRALLLPHHAWAMAGLLVLLLISPPRRQPVATSPQAPANPSNRTSSAASGDAPSTP